MEEDKTKPTVKKKRGHLKKDGVRSGRISSDKQKPAASTKSLVPADPLQRYLHMVREIPRLTPEEEHRLAVRVKRFNDQDAALRLVTSHLWVVINIAFEFRAQFRNILDLIQEGNIGLMQAVKRFDPFRGVKLPSYAAYWIRAYMLKYILDNWRLVRVGTTNVRRKLLFNLGKVTRELQAAGIKPEARLLAEHFSASEKDVRAVQEAITSSDVSLDAKVSDDSKRTYAEVIGEEKPGHDEALGDKQVSELVKKHINEFAKTLRSAERAILYGRLMSDKPLTLAEIGEKHGVTREAIRQTEARLIKKLKKRLEEKIPGISGFSFAP
ncbi:MAG: RNA polymerase sigma factor [bacterium]|nr:MAG: RNA polymerase sigma factor [bacterium]